MTRLVALALAAGLVACRPSGPEVTMMQAPQVAGAAESADPALAVDPASQDLLLSWVAGQGTEQHLYFARSSDGGTSWSAPVRVTDREQDIKPHAEASPRMLAGNGVIALFWPNNIEVPGRRFPASHMRMSRSTDGGKTWTQAITLNDDTTRALAGHTFHGAAARNDELMVAWLDSRVGAEPHTEGDPAVHHDGDATIYMATSRDGGLTWDTQNRRLWGDACPCCRVSLATTPDNQVLASWRGHFDGSVRDPVVARLDEEAGPPQRVKVDGWVFQGCPHTGPALGVDGQGGVHVAWFTGKEGGAGVFYARAASAGDLTFGEPVALVTGTTLPAAHPAIVPTSHGALVAINLDGQAQRVLTLASVNGTSVQRLVVPDTDGADHPQLTLTGAGSAVVAWTQKRGTGSTMRLATVTVPAR